MAKEKTKIENKLFSNVLGLKEKNNVVTPTGQGDINMSALFAGLAFGLYDINNVNINSTPEKFYDSLKSVKSKSKLDKLYNKSNSINNNIVSIKTMLDKYFNTDNNSDLQLEELQNIKMILGNMLSNKNNNDSTNDNKILGTININITNSSELKDFINLIKENNNKDNWFENYISSILKISNLDPNKLESISKNLISITDTLNSSPALTKINSLLKSLYSTLDNTNINDSLLIQIKSINEFLNVLSNLQNVNINDANIFRLSILFEKNGALDSLIKNIGSLLSNNINVNINNINTLNNIFETIGEICNFGFVSIIKGYGSIIFINKFIIPKLRNTLDNLSSLFSDTQLSNNVKNGIDTISLLFKMITNININSDEIQNLYDYINNIDDIIKYELSNIIDSLLNISDKYNKKYEEIQNVTNIVSNIIGSLIKSFNSNEFNLDKLNELFEDLNDVINYDLNNIIKNISKLNKLGDDEIKNINDIYKIIVLISNLPFPKKLNLVSGILQIELFNEEINILNNLLNNIKDTCIKCITNHVFEYLESFYINFKNASDKSLIPLINEIHNIYQQLNFKDLYNLYTYLIGVEQLCKYLKKLDKYDEITLVELLMSIENIDDIIKKLNEVYTSNIDTLKNGILLVNQLKDILESITKLKEYDSNIQNAADIISNGVSDFVDALYEVNLTMKDIDLIDDDKIKKIDSILNVVEKLAKISNIIVSAKLTEIGIKALDKEADLIVTIINKLGNIDNNNVKNAEQNVKSFVKLVLLSTIGIALGALIMSTIDFKSLLIFVGVLSLFTFGLMFVFNKLSSKEINNNINISKDLGLLILVSGLTLAIGSYIVNNVDLGSLVIFTLALTGFIIGLSLAYGIGSKLIKKSFKVAKEFTNLILVSAAVLLLGSLLYHYIKWEDLVGFGILLSGFIFLITGIYGLFGLLFKRTLKIANNLGELIAVSAAVLIVGSLIFKYLNWGDVFGFGIGLGVFILCVTAPLILFGRFGKKIMKSAEGLSKLIAISAATLILGPALISLIYGSFEEGIKKIFTFGLILAGFIFIVALPFIWISKHGGKLLLGAIGLSILIAVATGALIAGPVLMKSYDVDFWNVLKFAIGLVVFCGIIYTVARFLSKKLGVLLKGTIGMIIILGLVYLTTKLFNLINKTVQGANLWKMLKAMGVMAGIITATGGLAFAAGALVSGPQALLFAAGVAAIGTIEGLVWGAAKVMQAIGLAMKNLTSAKRFGDNKEQIIKSIVAFGEIMKEAGKLSGKSTNVMKASIDIEKTSKALSSLGVLIQDWANLKVRDYSSNSLIPKYRQMTPEDFCTAAGNIYVVLTCLGEAIKETYNKNTNIFEGSWGGLGNTPLQKVAKSMKFIGPMLSSIGKGIKDWADFKIPIYDNKGETISYQTLNSGSLQNAADNIERVIVAIGNAIKNTVNDPKNSEIFSEGQFGNAPAIIAAKAIKIMGETLNLTANIVSCYASGNFPIIGKNGKMTTIHIGDKDLFLAAIKINVMLTLIGNAIKNTVNDPKNIEIFKESNSSNAPVMIAVKAINQMSLGLNSIINIIDKLTNIKLEDLKLGELTKKISDIIGWVIGIIVMFNDPVKFTKTVNGIYQESFINKTNWFGEITGKVSIGEYINKNIPEIIKYINAIIKTSKGINNVIISLINLNKLLSDNQLNAINDDNTKMLANKIKYIIDMQNSITSIGGNELGKLNRYIKYDDKVVNVVKKIIEIVRKYDELIKLINNSKSINKSKLNNFFTLSKTVNNIAQSLNINYGKTNSKHFDLLCEGLKKIYSTFNEFEETKGFKSYANDVSNFIEKINSLNLNKLSQMNSLIKSMNELASKMNGLDKLSEALSDNLTLVLRELLYQLQKAEASINNAHKLQEKRRELIQDSIYKIKNIMDKHMIVEVYNKKSEDNNTDYKYASLNGSTISPSTSTSSTSTNSAAESVSSTPELTSPENAGSTELSKNTESNKDEALTKDAFINLMRQHMKLWDA